MTSFTGGSRRARPIGVSSDGLHGAVVYVVFVAKTGQKWVAWCACRPDVKATDLDDFKAAASVVALTPLR